MDLLSALVKKGILSDTDAAAVRKRIAKGDHIEDALLGQGMSEHDLLNAKSDYYGVPPREFTPEDLSFEIFEQIPSNSVGHYKILPLELKEGVLHVGFVDPDDQDARDAVQFITSKKNMPWKAYVISKAAFEKAQESSSSLTGEVGRALTDLETELSVDEKKLSDQVNSLKEEKEGDENDASKIVEDAPVTKIVATILRYAAEGGASDVHIEPVGESVRVRFRIDGVLHTSLSLPRKVQDAVTARIKILTNMKLDEKRKPQDGRFSAHIDGRKIDFRVSTFPTYYGEKIVMRLLDSEKGVVKLAEIGLSERDYKLVMEAIHEPYGMILISGPTGSGKTTTLYSMLNELDRERKNVLSLEDPVEYNIKGMNQSQIHPEIGYTFANGLRTTLRQDPDIIMVGEIRDKETAALAIQAALTGHLVLSTIHTNSATGVIPRLVDMGIDPYLISPTLILAIAQRLVKQLCPDSGKSIPVEGSVKMMIEKEFADLPPEYRSTISIPDHVYSASSGPGCPNGTRGRAAVFEVFKMTKEVEQVTLNNPSDTALYEVARKQGMLTMREDALLKSFDKIVPFEEVSTL